MLFIYVVCISTVLTERSANMCHCVNGGKKGSVSFLYSCQKACLVHPCKFILLHVCPTGFVAKQTLQVEMRTVTEVIQ